MKDPVKRFFTFLLIFSWTLLLRRISTSSALYFPQSNLILRLPYLANKDVGLNSNVKLLTLRTLRNDSTIPKEVKYRISGQREKFAILDEKTNTVWLRTLPKDNVSDDIIVQAKENAGDVDVLNIKVQSLPIKQNKINCADYVQDMCFWNSSQYRIYENQPATMLGPFGPEVYTDICPDFRVIGYELLNGTNYFHVINNTLYANSSLDRDVLGPVGGPGPRVNIEVRCLVYEEITGIQYALLRILGIDILDQDDNPPIAQMDTVVEITLRDFTAGDRLDDNNLMVKDADEIKSNRYIVRILEDIHNALNITYDTMPIEHPKHPENPVSTAIYTRIYAKTTLLPKSPYRVILQVKDESLLPGHGENSVNTTLLFIGPQHRTTTPTAASIPLIHPIYPENVRISRFSSRYFRVAQPRNKTDSRISFSIHGSKAFNVTKKDGIVHVINSTLLKTSPTIVSLRLEWRIGEQPGSSTTIKIMIDVSPSKLNICNQIEEIIHSCANAESRRDCELSCGVGGGNLNKDTYVGQCIWRSNNNSMTTQMSERYATCSPDLNFCPDHTCDELERLDHRICPQDCTIESEVHFAEMNKGGRGIRSGLGMCSCNDMVQCTCGLQFYRKINGGGGSQLTSTIKEGIGKLKEDDKNKGPVHGAQKASSESCGPICMISVTSAAIFVFVVIIGFLATWRYRMTKKGTRRECKHRVEDGSNGMGILPSDYIDRGDSFPIGLDTFATVNRHLLPKTCPPDPKWEFPRSRLTIEQVLGEGEFGRVLRAKAIDIGGWLGPTTVAVKTLKEDACASELADLLSEYQLLKEAQHPNVIRLLGACTSPGGPVYLIIEFAEFGSLRNYLRRSRHLESEGRVLCLTSLLSASPNNIREELQQVDTLSNYTITPRDILSFAWQISKGMAYLADIKLVHRDLAARNVLLATGKVCKISDFGLTRDVYEDDAYLKRSKGRVPVKWMAPESLADHVYTSKSDVWSFGVLLWELVTLGASPYPGVDVHNLYNLLKAGYRMEKPANCSQQLYKLMVSCWHEEPGMRPSFKELTCHWERMLEDGVEYLDLNPRTVHNQAYFASLHALDSPTSSGDQGIEEGKVNILRTDTVNYLSKPSSEPVTKCDKVDKLHAFWQEPIASFPIETVKSPYVNDRPPSLNINHYESPIKLRNTSVTSNSENDLKTPPNERPQSYIDMQGKKTKETDDLLLFGSLESKEDNYRTD
ncbi:proto-oncogene tyrosine-protein kinase receptor Ret isoform X1 [Vespa velutina]|uniref:proto-oncogene tyrosine-protein kinase receptor Ret isoform X1 n=1 Tax=Vespa velutina TaxID=202808 RepID=UPI001FB5045B|nr:proto-oncogene tyrosine-protein kinase receptor Ret isoform X1 [Vespa velutina]